MRASALLLLWPLTALPLAFVCAACGAPSAAAPNAGAPTAATAAASPLDLTRSRARTILAAATDWRAEHASGTCPTVADLKASRNLSALADDLDAWGRPFIVKCGAADTRVVSAGPDGLEASADDVETQPAPAPLSKAGPAPEKDRQAISNDPVKPSFATDDPVQSHIYATIVSRVHPRAQECFDRAGGAKGAVVGKIIIAPDGTKKKGTLNAVGGCPSEVVTCVGHAIEELTFDPTGDKADRTVDFHYP